MRIHLPSLLSIASRTSSPRARENVSKICCVTMIGVLGLSAATVPAQTSRNVENPVTAAPPAPSRTIWVLPSTAQKQPLPAPSTVLVEGLPATVFEHIPLEGRPWDLLVTIDLPLVHPASLQAFALWMAERAHRLAELGAVTLTLRGTARSVLLDASRDANEIAAAMVELSLEADRAGEYFSDRRATLDKLAKTTTAKQQRRTLVDHFHEEQQLLEWQHQSLLDDLLIENSPYWLRSSQDSPTPPQAVFLLRDDLGATTLAFVEQALKDHGSETKGLSKTELVSGVRLLTQRLERTAKATGDAMSGASRVLAASGYHIFPATLGLGTTPASDRPTGQTVGNRILEDATAGKLAGGNAQIIASQETLDQALSVLDRAIAVRFSTEPLGPVNVDRTGEIFAVNISPVFRGDGKRAFWISSAPPKSLTLARARRFLEGLDRGPLRVEAGLLGALAGGATLEAALDVESLAPDGGDVSDRSQTPPATASDQLRVTVVHQRIDQNLELEQLYGGHQPLDKKRWLVRTSVHLPRDLDAVAVIVEDLSTGRWGAAMAEEISDSLEQGYRTAEVVIEDVVSPHPGVSTRRIGGSTTARPEPKRNTKDLVGEPTRRATTNRFKPPVLQVVAPARDQLKGEQKFAVLLSTQSVRSVVFYLDDEEIRRDDRAPFSATIQLGEQTTQRSVRAVGYSASGLLLGSDEVVVNRPLRAQGLKITSLKRVPSINPTAGEKPADALVIEAQASLRLNDEAALDRVEFYRNQELLATMTTTPLRATVGPIPTPEAAARGDFVRIVAWLTDGSFIEDVRLLGVGSDAGLGDFGTGVQVNLVQVFAVVNNADGDPIDGLNAENFALELNGKPLTVERFSEAEQVPLDLALVVDSSESMWALMDDTRKAAARFLGDTLADDDRAMVIDFDNSVRLVHPLSNEVFKLIQSLSKLKASGATALYDSIIFALVNLEDAARNRRAVVLLTDGDDYNSRFPYGRVYESSRFAGVPLYFLALSDFFGDQRRGVRKTDLESFAEASGGRVFYVKSMQEILSAYRRISRELRSQYLLTFATEQQLSREQLEKVVVKVRGKGRRLDVRWTVGAGR